MKEITFLIPTRFNNRWPLDLTLRTIRKYTKNYPYRIIVGDAGADEELQEFLSLQKDVEVLKCKDQARPKDELVRAVKTPYFMVLHDDIQVLKPDWIEKRVKILEKKPYVSIIGELGFNDNIHGFFWKRFVDFSPLNRRFFPLVLLVRKEVQDELDLVWRSVKGFDTGAIAYFQFSRQNKWKFVRLPFKYDVKHWAGMTWIMKYKHNAAKWVEKLREQKLHKIKLIQEMIQKGNY